MTNEAVSKSKTNIQSVTIKVKSGEKKNGLTIKAAVSMVHHPQAISKSHSLKFSPFFFFLFLWETHLPIIERERKKEKKKKLTGVKTITRRHWTRASQLRSWPNRLLKSREAKCHKDRRRAACYYSFWEVNRLRSMAAVVYPHHNYGAVKHKGPCGSDQHSHWY